MTAALRDICAGRWQSLLPMLGIDRRYLTGQHGPCPICGQGRDRFRFDDKEGRGTWICSKCGSGDGFSLVMRTKGWDFKTCADEVSKIVGHAERTETRRSRDEKSLRRAMNHLWSTGQLVKQGDPVAYYLSRRGIELEQYPADLRYVDRCLSVEEGVKTYHPAMLAKVRNPDNSPSTIHRTYLGLDGRKAEIAAPRKLMPGKIGKGCAIRLAPYTDTLGIAEGIETALSAMLIHGVPVWAAVSAGMLMAWEPPADVREILIFGDRDGNFAGQSAAYALAHRLSANGRTVRVLLPEIYGDWNDALKDWKHGNAA